MDAARNGSLPVTCALLAQGAVAQVEIPMLATPLNTASAFGHEAIVRALLAAGADPNVRFTGPGGTIIPLVTASQQGYEGIVRALLAAGADPNLSVKGFMGSTTAMGAASNAGHEAIVQILLAAGAH
jgi:ankyrin repeat protein